MKERARKPFRPGNYKSEHAAGDGGNGDEQRRDAYDWITLITAIVGVIIVCASTGITAYQAIVTRQQLDNAVSQQRAWLKLSIEPKGQMFGPRDYITFGISATNVGNLPAQNVASQIAVLPVPAHQYMDVSSAGYSARACNADGIFLPAQTIFPGETTKEFASVGYMPKGALQAARDKYGEVVLLLSVCLRYDTGAMAPYRMTGAVFVVTSDDTAPRFGIETESTQKIRIARLGQDEVAN